MHEILSSSAVNLLHATSHNSFYWSDLTTKMMAKYNFMYRHLLAASRDTLEGLGTWHWFGLSPN